MPAVAFDAVDIVFGDRRRRRCRCSTRASAASRSWPRPARCWASPAARLAVERGEICVLMGLSGSGKSTLLRAVNRLNSGRARLGAGRGRRRPVDVATCDAARAAPSADAPHRHGVPAVRAAALAHRGRERRLRPRAARRAQGRARPDRHGEAGAGPSREMGRQVRARALRRHAAAGRPRPRLRHRRRHPADGRAVLRPGPADPRQAAGRSARAAAAAATRRSSSSATTSTRR